jgi:hypothetical protein
MREKGDKDKTDKGNEEIGKEMKIQARSICIVLSKSIQ